MTPLVKPRCLGASRGEGAYLRAYDRVRKNRATCPELDVAEQVHPRAETAPGPDDRSRGDHAKSAERCVGRETRARVDHRGGVVRIQGGRRRDHAAYAARAPRRRSRRLAHEADQRARTTRHRVGGVFLLESARVQYFSETTQGVESVENTRTREHENVEKSSGKVLGAAQASDSGAIVRTVNRQRCRKSEGIFRRGAGKFRETEIRHCSLICEKGSRRKLPRSKRARSKGENRRQLITRAVPLVDPVNEA